MMAKMMGMVMAEWVIKEKGLFCDGRIDGGTDSHGDGDGRIGHECDGDGKMGGKKTVTVVASERKKKKSLAVRKLDLPIVARR